MRHLTSVLVLAALINGAPAYAQDPDKVATVQIGGGYTWALSEVHDYLGNGGNFNIGVNFNLSRAIAIEGLYSFNGLGSKTISLPVSATPNDVGIPTDFSADMNMQYGTASVVFNSPKQAKVRPYGLVGVGVYYRPVTVTTPGVGYVAGFCSPFWYYCVPGGFVPTENVVGERSSTDPGMVVGAGANFAVGEGASVFVELRYHYIWGPEINTGAAATITGTNSINANGQFLPLTFGVRF